MRLSKALAKQLGDEHKHLKARYETIAKQVADGDLPDSPAMQEALSRIKTMLGQISRGTNEIRGSR